MAPAGIPPYAEEFIQRGNIYVAIQVFGFPGSAGGPARITRIFVEIPG
ncbi:MAG: hypothetical protein AAGE18_17970 [Pseudomonadota bacterium]